MQRYNGQLINQFANKVFGNSAAGVLVTVREKETGNLATLYADNDVDGAGLSNPLTSDTVGAFSFYAADGVYTLDFSYSGTPQQVIQLQDVGVLQQQFEDAVLNAGYIPSGTFSAGATLTQANQVLSDGSSYWRWDGSFPKVVSAGSSPTPTGVSNWILVSDGALRGDLAAVGSTVLVGGVEAGRVGGFILKTGVLSDGRPAITKLTVGDEVLSSPAIRDAVVVGSTITGLTDSHAFADRTIIDSFSDGGTYGTFDATTKYAHTSGTANHLYTFQGRGQKAGAGNLDNYCSFYSQPTLSGGTVVDHHHFRAYDNAGTSAITNQHAIHIRPLTSATNNYAIFSWGETPSIHVGKFTIGTFTTDTTAAVAAVSKINMTGINQYGFKSDCGANSAALTSYSAYMARVNLGGTGYTLPIGSGLMIEDANLAGGTTLTAQYGLYVKNQTKGGVNAAMRLDVTKGSNKWNLYATADADNYLKGNLGIDVFVPSARIEIRASQSGSELAPIKLQAGALLPTPQNGAIEFDGTNLYFTVGGVRKTVTLV